MIIRFRGRDGTYRIDADPSQSFGNVVSQLSAQLPAHSALRVSVNPTSPAHARSSEWDRTLTELNIKHGDLYFVQYDPPEEALGDENGHTLDAKSTSDRDVGGDGAPDLSFDKVDDSLDTQDGKIPRGRSSMCRHGPKGMCEYCQPLEPWDEGYRNEHKTKHLSYHAYVKRLQDELGRKKVLDEPSYTVKPNCPSGHAPWPNGICSKCQPSAITLQQQSFRMVDHVEFADPGMINGFIEFWRQTGTQRLGIMMGEYQEYKEVPLGIKAVVHAIYEPEQAGVSDGLTLESFINASVVAAGRAFSWKPVGVIFTDLTDVGDGKVLSKRHANSYFLSSLEIRFAATLQLKNPSASIYSDSGKYSSKFVTCVVSGNDIGEIDMACYQVSLQAEAMVKADLVVPSTNPAVMRIKLESKTRYVPDVFFKHFNEYNLAVQEDAKPAFPDDYFLVSLSHGFPDSPLVHGASFPIENRPAIRSQTVGQLVDVLELNDGLLSNALADFHLLAYLFSLGVLQPDEQELVERLVKTELANGSSEEVISLATQVAHSNGFHTLRMLAAG